LLNTILGSLSSGVVAAVGDYESIATVTVGSGGATDVTFSSIPATYTHLQIRGIGRGTDASKDVNIYFQFNGDTATNYSAHGLYGTGAVASAFGSANSSDPIAFRTSSGNSTSGTFGVGVMDILDYANTNKFKTIRSLTGHDENGTDGMVWLFSANWRSTSAITSIKLYGTGYNLAQFSQFALYGIKGS
jgi:hypothetical protein